MEVRENGMQDFAVARRAMVDSQLRPEGVIDAGVINAMASVPREEFVPAAAQAVAYGDRPIALGNGRAMPSPAVTGRWLSALAPRRGEKALIVGSGGGYSAALLEALGLEVTALESDASPSVAAAPQVGSIKAVTGDLAAGHRAGAPYDIILIDGAVDRVPDAIAGQLIEGGRLATAINDRGVSRLVIGRNVGGRIAFQTIVDADVAPLPGFAQPAAFVF